MIQHSQCLKLRKGKIIVIEGTEATRNSLHPSIAMISIQKLFIVPYLATLLVND
jgi:hypothetical protein